MNLPSKYFNLYAHTHRPKTLRRHRLAGARVGSVGVKLAENLPTGWKASVNVGRFGVDFRLHRKQSDPEIEAWLNLVVKTEDWQKNIKQGRTDFDEGRYYSVIDDRRSPSVPSPTWKPDDLSQPTGWEHNGTKWVMSEGWEQDPMGFWHYKPRERAARG